MLKTVINIFLIVGTLIFSGCIKEDKKAKDELTILSVEPATGLKDGEEYELTVEVDYKLTSADKGSLSIGYNRDDPNQFFMLIGSNHIVEKGSGSHTFNVLVTAKDWGNLSKFGIMVNISEYPVESTPYFPLVSEIEYLEME